MVDGCIMAKCCTGKTILKKCASVKKRYSIDDFCDRFVRINILSEDAAYKM